MSVNAFLLLMAMVATTVIARNEEILENFKKVHARLPVYENQCDPPFKAVEGGYCYFLAFDQMSTSWRGAQLVCSWLHPDSRLAEFETLNELVDATLFLTMEKSNPWTQPGPWIGAIELGDSNVFVWDSTNTTIEDTNWSASEPDSPSSGDGVALDTSNNFEWIDANNETSLPFLCEIEANPPPIAWRCPEGFFRLANSCYAYGDTEQLNWWDAQSYCGSLTAGGRLAEIETVEELSLLTAHLAENPTANCDRGYFIGAEDVGSNNHYKWASSGTPVAFYSWFPGQPNNDGADDAIAIRCNYNWNWGDDDKAFVQSRICEADLIHQ